MEFLSSMTVHCQNCFVFVDRPLERRRIPCEWDPVVALGVVVVDDIFAVDVHIGAFAVATADPAVVAVVAGAHPTAVGDSFAASGWIQGVSGCPLTTSVQVR